ncbi:Guanine nucleotide-binding-like protein 1 [Podila epigama]|nr:Guanine nucleotide-binding-like protein 1 [Podila epigama]
MPRPVCFSGALKRKQLREKRERNAARHEEAARQLEVERQAEHDRVAQSIFGIDPGHVDKKESYYEEKKVSHHGEHRRVPVSENSNHPVTTKLRSVFMKRSAAEIQESKLESMKPLELLPESSLEVSFEQMFPNVIGFPKRPKWDYSMSREDLEKNEHQMFEAWMDSVYNRYPAEELSYFEHNLDVWRQLWRVLEISDIIMIIVDICHPVIHFPPSLYDYVVKEMNRKLVVVFNKIDLVAPNTVFAWTEYFKEKFPKLHVAAFSCYARDPSLINDTSTAALQRVVKRPRHRVYNALGVKDVLVACKDVELSKQGVPVDWDTLISQYVHHKKEGDVSESDEDERYHDTEDKMTRGDPEKLSEETERSTQSVQTMVVDDTETTPHKDYVTIGLVGHPNVGKSSLINSIMGKTVVSTSRTPGHTKHFQTIHLTHNVRLCDSPGLVFPSLLPKPLQILSGMYPVAQVQEPYSVVDYLARHINLPRLLNLEPPPNYNRGPFRWSAYGICESYGLQRGFLIAKSGYPDVYRAANALLRLANEGRILLSFKPPGFFTSTKYEKLRVEAADATSKMHASGDDHESDDDDSEEEEEEDDDDDDKDENQGQPNFSVKSRVGGFFGLLQDDEEEEGNDEDEDSDSDKE